VGTVSAHHRKEATRLSAQVLQFAPALKNVHWRQTCRTRSGFRKDRCGPSEMRPNLASTSARNSSRGHRSKGSPVFPFFALNDLVRRCSRERVDCSGFGVESLSFAAPGMASIVSARRSGREWQSQWHCSPVAGWIEQRFLSVRGMKGNPDRARGAVSNTWDGPPGFGGCADQGRATNRIRRRPSSQVFRVCISQLYT